MKGKGLRVGVRGFNNIVIVLLSLYKTVISPLLPQSCRFYPTCSTYARGCFGRFSFFKALGFTAMRLARCHPFCKGGGENIPS